MTDQELEFRVRGVEGSLRGLPERSCLYQYARVMCGFDLPRQDTYSDAAIEGLVHDRLAFLKETAAFRRINLFWCLTMEPSTTNPFQRKPKEQANENSRMLTDLEKTATILLSNLGNTIGLQQLDKNQTFQFFSYLFNLEEWAGDNQLRHDTGVDRQIVNSPVGFQDDQLQVGKRHIQMFSLVTTPESSRPYLFSGLLGLDCDTVVCSTWRPKSASAARKEVDNQERFTSFFKVGVANRLMSGRDFASMDKTAGGRAADKGVDDISDVSERSTRRLMASIRSGFCSRARACRASRYRLRVTLALAALAGGEPGDIEPGVICQKLNEPLANHAGGPENAYITPFHSSRINQGDGGRGEPSRCVSRYPPLPVLLV